MVVAILPVTALLVGAQRAPTESITLLQQQHDVKMLVAGFQSDDVGLEKVSEQFQTSTDMLSHVGKKVAELEARVEKDPTSLVQADTDDIQTLIDMLQDDFLPTLVAQNTADGSSYGARKIQLEDCVAHLDQRLHAVSGDVSKQAGRVTTTREKHAA